MNQSLPSKKISYIGYVVLKIPKGENKKAKDRCRKE